MAAGNSFCDGTKHTGGDARFSGQRCQSMVSGQPGQHTLDWKHGEHSVDWQYEQYLVGGKRWQRAVDCQCGQFYVGE